MEKTTDLDDPQRRRIHLLRKIKDFTRSIVGDLAGGRSPEISINKYRNYCTNSDGNCFCSCNLVHGKEVLTLKTQCQVHRIDVLLKVLAIVQQLLQENRHASKRDIYYMYPSVFTEQSIVDRAINEICIILECSRHNLNVVSVAKGLVMGWIRFSEVGNRFDCISSPNSPHPVPVHVEDVSDIFTIAQYILIVEKESVFQRLANDHFCSANHCIVITGRGYPDISTRRFLRVLVEKLNIPVYCLVDCDPYGFDILTTYRFGSIVRVLNLMQVIFELVCLYSVSLSCLGVTVFSGSISSKLFVWTVIFPLIIWLIYPSPLLFFYWSIAKQMAYDAKYLQLPEICWLGAFISDSEKYSLPSECLLPLTSEDKKKAEAMVHRCYLQCEEPEWRLELERMLEKGVKFEIEALSVHSLSFLTQEYLPAKIQGMSSMNYIKN